VSDLIRKMIGNWESGKVTDIELALMIIEIHRANCDGCIQCL